ncbi:MAG: hypothetical protein PHH46_11625 [Firmicutes bacterium]|nr:hypothetical protein [Bacillota bacterium]
MTQQTDLHGQHDFQCHRIPFSLSSRFLDYLLQSLNQLPDKNVPSMPEIQTTWYRIRYLERLNSPMVSSHDVRHQKSTSRRVWLNNVEINTSLMGFAYTWMHLRDAHVADGY